MVSECHSIPEYRSIAWLVRFTVAVFPNYILDRVELRPTVIGINDNLSPSHFALLVTIHEVFIIIWVDGGYCVYLLLLHVLRMLLLLLLLLRRVLHTAVISYICK